MFHVKQKENMKEELSRTESLIGSENLKKLRTKTIAVFGLGGVGSFATEALARCSIENFILVDNDKISLSNINRQLYALHSTVGRLKTEIASERILDINPICNIKQFPLFYLQDTADKIDLSGVDYIVDCIDTVSAKILLAEKAQMFHVKHISSMGTGNKLNPFKFEITDISKTSVCPLARVMRYELRKRNIEHLKVLYSQEKPIETTDKKNPASISFVPSVAGLMIAGEVIKDLLENN